MMLTSRYVFLPVLLAALTAVPLHAAPAQAKPSATPATHRTTAEGVETAPPTQASVAAKGAFASVSATDAAVARALDARDKAGLQKLASKTGAFKGTVTQVYSPQDHSVLILDFAPNYRDADTAVLQPDDYAKFPDMRTLASKTVLVTGPVALHHERPQVALTSPDQIKIIH